jgi:hypothetical protein
MRPPCRGSDLEQPFQCPLDYLLPLKDLDASGVDYRPPGFLTLPQVRHRRRVGRPCLPTGCRQPPSNGSAVLRPVDVLPLHPV